MHRHILAHMVTDRCRETSGASSLFPKNTLRSRVKPSAQLFAGSMARAGCAQFAVHILWLATLAVMASGTDGAHRKGALCVSE